MYLLDANKSNILILGDEYGINFHKILNGMVNSERKYKIFSIIKSNAELTHLTERSFENTLDFGKLDHIIVMFNTNNVSNIKSLNQVTRHLLPLGRTTNIIIVAKLNTPSDIAIVNNMRHNIESFRKNIRNISISLLVDPMLKGSKFKAALEVKEAVLNNYVHNNIVLKPIKLLDETMASRQFFREKRI
ncbi:hypothetical protein JTB14_011011 [Gonioctena quinquepunctata]|nr:hypothetical protein JTB14_011011 [Gonioctena quinquepunctata]